jgi:serine/threonine protein kinase
VCDALAEAHGIGLIHRDVKPANIILNHRGGIADFVKVLDFGLVKPVGPGVRLTSNDVMIGTPLYMAPEAIEQPDTMDARSDIYALGAVAYFLVTGGTVFTGQTTLELCRQHLQEQPKVLSERLGRRVSPDLEAVIMNCLAKRPNERPRSAADLSDQLGRCLAAGSWTKDDAEAWWQQNAPAVVTSWDTLQPSGDTAARSTKAAVN